LLPGNRRAITLPNRCPFTYTIGMVELGQPELMLFGRERLTEPAVRQLVWADADGRFPDDPSCNPKIAAMQPVLKVDPHRYPKIEPRRISSHRKRKKRR
jgi:hypothetical protein